MVKLEEWRDFQMTKRKALIKICSAMLAVVIISFSSISFAASEIKYNASSKGTSFENGTKFSQGAVKVVNLKGTWHQIGRQYGHLLKDELHDIYYNKLEAFMKEHPDKAQMVKKIAEDRYNDFPYKYKEVVRGIAETSKLNLEQVKIVNAVEYASGVTGCSGFSVWNDYSKNKDVVYGRNYDFFPSFKKINNHVVVAVYHPSDGSLAAATIGYTGEIYAVNGLNEKGVFLELNNGGPSGRGMHNRERIHGTVSLMSLLFDADSLDYVDKFFKTTATNAAYIIGVADSNVARSYEWAVDGVKQGDSTPGALILSNHFTNPTWKNVQTTDSASWFSLTRRKNMLALAEKYKGQIDPALMQDLMARRVEKDGPMSDLTVFQMVVEPKDMNLWLKVTDASDWTKINLGSFLKVK